MTSTDAPASPMTSDAPVSSATATDVPASSTTETAAAPAWHADPAPPAVSAVVCTRDRPKLLLRAVRSLLDQDYPGHLEVVVVFDRQNPVPLDLGPGDTRTAGPRSLRVLTNARRPGLAGARNTGIAAATGLLLAFCDDDDAWAPGKLTAQVDLLRRHPEAVLAATGITIHTEDDVVQRSCPRTVLDHAAFLASRWAEVHPSSYLLFRADLVEGTGRIGPVDEHVPQSYGEDYELLLRATRHGPVVTVPDCLTHIYWNRPSYFSMRWEAIGDGLSYLLEQFPEFAQDRRGRGRVRGQVAFARAAAGRRTEALRWAGAALSDDPRQLRAWAAVAVALRLVGPKPLVERVQATGKGL